MQFTNILRTPNATLLTLFTRAQCGLCDTAKLTISKLHQRRTFEYKEVDIMASENKHWKDVYEFDVPVLHVDSPQRTTQEPWKLFHRFTEQEVEHVIDQAKS